MLAKFKKDYTVFLENNKEFTFEKGYSYMISNIEEKLVICNLDGSVEIRLDKEEREKYIEKLYIRE